MVSSSICIRPYVSTHVSCQQLQRLLAKSCQHPHSSPMLCTFFESIDRRWCRQCHQTWKAQQKDPYAHETWNSHRDSGEDVTGVSHRNISWIPSSLNMGDTAVSPLVATPSCWTWSTIFERRSFGILYGILHHIVNHRIFIRVFWKDPIWPFQHASYFKNILKIHVVCILFNGSIANDQDDMASEAGWSLVITFVWFARYSYTDTFVWLPPTERRRDGHNTVIQRIYLLGSQKCHYETVMFFVNGKDN